MFTESHHKALSNTPQYELGRNLIGRLRQASSFGERVAILEEAEEVFDQLEVREHAIRVADLSRDLALHCDFGSDYANKLRNATRLHDVGKLLMPMAILEKNTALTDEEFDIIKQHARHGGELLGPDAPDFTANIARYHHERYDGKGYNNIVGENIPVEARLVQVADVFDALKSKRAYKEEMPEEDTLLKMISIQKSGVVFDPYFLRKFVDMRLSMNVDNDISDSAKQQLKAFASSDPMTEIHALSDASVLGGWKIAPNGQRGRYEHNSSIDYDVLVEKRNVHGDGMSIMGRTVHDKIESIKDRFSLSQNPIPGY